MKHKIHKNISKIYSIYTPKINKQVILMKNITKNLGVFFLASKALIEELFNVNHKYDDNHVI